MWIVKLGGSLLRDPRLREWLQMLAEFGGGLVTVVPGGASFADAVREAQARWHFDDVVAHNMAVLAMAQTAHMLHGSSRAWSPPPTRRRSARCCTPAAPRCGCRWRCCATRRTC
jgi:aspartokinase-like uncharacterized kinase